MEVAPILVYISPPKQETRDTDHCDEVFAGQLVKKHLVASIPLSSFYSRAPAAQKIPICFARRDETLDRATSILRSI
jgi:methionine aminotransferase